ncbi:PilZ domain-containing protein [Thiogranum longum]|uniref:PilZ domain-containing protein n=1 Tax=Thiogranum longum TaxID=1537524 RepID=A0A4R1HAZ0_9GAMM|nr:PilZ domain-containing protein [Thiogranum longum]TCK17355.1 PilZ domain-containing protein [Thiogranum longum]
MSDERREFFRIDDEVALDYRLIDHDEVDQLLEKIQSQLVDRFTAASSFTATTRQMMNLIHKVQAQSPELARCLQAIDQKLNMIAQLFVSEEIKEKQHDTREVNLSAGGVAFRAQHELPVGSLLELRMVLFPSLVGILTISRVVHCERVKDGNPQYPWQIAVEYEHLKETDRELLVRHIMARETEQLRRQRTENDD